MSDDDWKSFVWSLDAGRLPSDWYDWDEHKEEICKRHPSIEWADRVLITAHDALSLVVRVYT